MNILIDAEEAFDKIQHAFIKQNKKTTKQEKASLHTRNRRNFSQPDKRHLTKTYS